MGVENRIAVITGATGGLGQVVANHFAKSGTRLVLVGSNADKLEALGNKLELPKERWLSVAVDLNQPSAAKAVLDASLAAFGRVDILLHLVGGWVGGKSIPQVTVDEVSLMLKQHFWTTFFLAQAFSPHMVANGWGRILIVSSPSVISLPANGLPYSIGKSAQEVLMITLAEELKGTGVTSNVLRVSSIDVNQERDRQSSTRPTSAATPEEIAAVMLFLCSEETGIVNGARIPLYGSP